jgi:predicted deacylase
MSKSFVPVSDFRDQIDFAFQAINCHWHACVNKVEHVQWFVNAMRRFNLLSNTDCKRATPEDKQRYERAFDLFAEHCQKHQSLWLDARLQSGSISEDQYKEILQIEKDGRFSSSTNK